MSLIITNIVCTCDLKCSINLRRLALTATNIRYDPKRFSAAIWQHRKIGGNCLVFSNGKICVNGKANTIEKARSRVRRYARMLLKQGWPVTLKRIKIITMSASYRLKGTLDMSVLVRGLGASYEPELFPAAMLKRESVHFTCFPNGKILLMGIRNERDLDDIVYPTFIELEMLSTSV